MNKRATSTCYANLGCFSTIATLHSLPAPPEQIATTFTLRTRASSGGAVLKAMDDVTTWRTALAGAGGFDVSKETKIITHGYQSSGSNPWLPEMAGELLKRGDYNVFITDWGHGSHGSYDQSTANCLLVAAQLGKLLNFLHVTEGVDLGSVHLIGHSLGAQISGNAAARAPGVGRITGLDPAEPYFKDFDNEHRLDKSDALFVDVIHTDGADFNLLQGYGMKDPMGHLDFYPNGGVDQPGCTDSAIGGILGALGGQQDNSIACSHSRSIRYFIESINSQCHFSAHPCASWDDYEQGKCHGCPTSGGCPQMGFHAQESSARGSYYLSTAEASPYCGHEYFVEMDLSGESIDSFGRIYLTFLGRTRNSREIEFTRENRHYHANDKEMHMVALHTEVGSVTGVKVRFHRGSGLASHGTAHHITVHRIIVEDAVSSQRTTFCTHDHHMNEDATITYRSHSGC
ncbi:pancreatic lipase-related protein 2-like [Babylonia areolata]|uniref:pancreatic lipase-related protein 2-like n=1 Tax=Babylonia areolata TaxID=304850 RepID=UPI003FCFFDEC